MMVFAFSPLVEYPYLVAGVFSGCAFLGVAYFALSLVNERRFQASRICVTSDGIERFSVLGRRRALAWHDAHLLEVSSRRYALYGSGAVVRWEVPVIRSGTLPRFWQIAPAVRLHTGLLPRTLNPDTLAPNASLDYARLAYVVARLPLGLFVATMILSFTQVDLTFVKGIVIPIGIGSSVWLVRFAARRWLGIVRPSDRQSTVPTSLPTLDSGAVYEMAVGSHSTFLFNQVLFVVLGLAAIGFSVFILGTQFAQFVLRVPGLHFYALPPAVMLFPVSLMGFGIAIVIISVRARDTVLLADASGLRKRWAMGTTFIPWSDVDRIERRRLIATPSYFVYPRDGRTLITWVGKSLAPSHRIQEQGAILTDPDGMAALVARQIGQEILIRTR